MKKLVYDIRELPEGNTTIGRSIDPDELELGAFESVRLEPIELNVRIQKTDHVISISGKSEGRYQYECSRCLKVFHESFEIKVEHSRSTEDLETAYSGKLDIGEMIREEILIGVDERPLCEPDCKGLCAGCGADMNEEICKCNPV